MISLSLSVACLKGAGQMSGENGQVPSKMSGNAPGGGVLSAGETLQSSKEQGASIWLSLVGVIAGTEDGDYPPRPYPLLWDGTRAVEPRAASVSAAPAVVAPKPGPVAPAPLPPLPEVASTPLQAAVGVAVSNKSEGRLALGAAARGDEQRAGGRRGMSRSRRVLRKRISLVVSLGILLVGGGLIIRDVFLRPTLPVGFSEAREDRSVAVTTVDAGAGEDGGEASENTIKSLELVVAGNSWDMSAPAWSSAPQLGAAEAAGAAGGGAEVVVRPLAEGTGPAPSKAFIDYAQTLKITVVAGGERVRATINGIVYTEGDVLEHGMGVRLVGRDTQDRALILEDANRARVKVNY